jgi:GT2 family glycosyltransferase
MSTENLVSFTSSGDPVDVTVLVVTYRSASTIDQLIQSIRRSQGDLLVSLLVIDNASDDATCSKVEAHEDVVLVRSVTNSGYAAGINLGMRAAPPSSVLVILNPDLEVAPTLLLRLVDAVRRQPNVGVAVPLLVDERGDRSLSLRNEPSVIRTLGDSLLGARWRSRPDWFGETIFDLERYKMPNSIDWATGAAMAVSDACSKAVGPWDDERFFLYSEETDYCRRVREAGYEVLVVPSALAEHKGGGSGSSPVLDGVLALSRVRYMRKHNGVASARLTWLALVAGQLLRIRRPGGAKRLGVLLRPRAYWRVVGNHLGGARASAARGR